MNDERTGLRVTGRRETQPTQREFPYPPEYTPSSDFGVYFSEGLLGEILSYARTGDVNLEHFGLLLGHLNTDPNKGVTWLDINYIVDSPPGIRATGTSVDVSIEQLTTMRDVSAKIKTYPGYEGQVEIGWWHSHPGLGAFFSGTDRDNQRVSYDQSWQVGLVVDPLRNQHALFKGPGSTPITPFIIPIKDYDIPGSRVFPFKSASLEDSQPKRLIVTARRP